MLVFLGVLLTVLFGLLVTLVISAKIHPLERLGLSYVLGLGLLTFLMFLGYLVGLKFTLVNTVVILLISIIFLLILTRNSIKSFFRELKALKKFPNFSLSEKLIIFVLVGLFIYSFLLSIYWPVADWDALSLYDFRARRFSETHSLAQSILTQGTREAVTYNYSYPFFTSLAHTFVYVLGGNNPKFIYSFIYLSLIGSFYFVLRRKVSRTTSLLFTAIIATDSEFLNHSTIAYTNLPYALFLGIGTIHLLQWMERKKDGQLILSALLLGLATWTRDQEPLWGAPFILLIAYCLYQRKFMPIFFYSLIFFSIQQPWRIYKNHIFERLGGAQFYKTYLYFDFTKIFPSIAYALQNFLVARETTFALFLLSLLFVFGKRKVKKYWHILTVMFLYLGIVLAGTYFFSLNFPWWNEIGGSVTRMSMFFQVLIFYFSAIVLSSGIKEKISFRLPEIKFKL